MSRVLKCCVLCLDSIAYIEFKTEAEAEKMLEEAQGADVQGRCIVVDYMGDKSQSKDRTHH